MKVLVTFDIMPGIVPTTIGGKPHVIQLDPEGVTRRLRRRLANAEISLLELDYEDPTTKASVGFIATMERFTAVEEV